MKKAFTLIELLVVILIVSVLVGIAIPVYSRFAENGRAVACLSNMRQLGAGLCYRGPGGLFVFAPLEGIFALHEQGPGMARYAGAILLLGVSMLTVTSLGFALSCFNMKPAAATIVTLSVVFLDSIFRNIPYFENIKSWFITTHMGGWLQIFVTYIPWWNIVEDYAYLLALDATCVVIALAAFQSRDFKG